MAGAQRRLALVELDSAPGMVGLAAQVVSLVNEEAHAQGYAVMGPDELRGRMGDVGYEALRKCDGNTGCVGARLQSVAVDQVVVGTLGRDEKSYQVKLWMVGLRPKLGALSEVDRPILIVGRRFKQDVASALPGLLRGEAEAQGTLMVTATSAGASVTLDGEPQGVTPLKLQVKPGKHEFQVEKAGYLPVRRFTAVEPREVTREDVRLIRVPGESESQGVAQGPKTSAAAPSVSGAGSGFRVPLGAWVLLGVGAGAAGVGTVFGAMSQRLTSDLQKSQDPSTKIYAATRTVALKARSDAMLANDFLIGAGAALVAGAVWTSVVAASGAGGANVHGSLSVGPSGGGILALGSF